MPRLKLSALVVYPVKAAAGISVRRWEVDTFGLRHDRRWMVVDSRGALVTQRTHPRLALVQPTIHEAGLILHAPDASPLNLALEPRGAVTVHATVWDDT